MADGVKNWPFVLNSSDCLELIQAEIGSYSPGPGVLYKDDQILDKYYIIWIYTFKEHTNCFCCLKRPDLDLNTDVISGDSFFNLSSYSPGEGPSFCKFIRKLQTTV